MTPGFSYRLIGGSSPFLQLRALCDPFLHRAPSRYLKIMMEEDMNIEPIDQRGTKRAAEEDEPLEPPKPKKIKVR